MPENRYPEIARLIDVAQVFIRGGALLSARDHLLKAAQMLEEEHVAKKRALAKLAG